jgi:hypothetical protein
MMRPNPSLADDPSSVPGMPPGAGGPAVARSWTRGATARRTTWLLGLIACLLAVGALAQLRGGRRGVPEFTRGSVPNWTLEPGFEREAFTFARVRYSSTMDRSSYAWWTDYPDADVNLSWRLHQLTALKVHPDGKVIGLTDPELASQPFLFMSGVPAIVMSDTEVQALRRHLLSGGFLLVDDFWGERAWAHFEREVLKRVFPERQARELPLDHPIFHFVFDLKEKPQIPNVFFATRNHGTGVTWEVEDGKTPHYRAILDDRGRLMVLACHNTDLGDGWEEEATNPDYFAEFSEPKAYPLAINIILYVMTH